MGMAHRGRLNVLANFLKKSLQVIFTEFSTNYIPDLVAGDGDVLGRGRTILSAGNRRPRPDDQPHERAGGGAGMIDVNGLIVTRLRVNSFITTLGTLGIGTGLSLVVSGGSNVEGIPFSIQNDFGIKELGAVPLPTFTTCPSRSFSQNRASS